jgi:glycosyltransferase involved in cell wall biosynthesis
MTAIAFVKNPLSEKKKCIRIFGSSNLVTNRYFPQDIREKIVIVLPTYNERENIIQLVPELEAIFAKNQINGYLLFVDDNSKDGTGKEAKSLARGYKNIMVISRPGKMGLGSAYRVGFKHAIKLGFSVIFMMDSDLSHRPDYIPTFLQVMKKTGADLVIGSRYCSGGGTDGWAFKRKMISSTANILARFLLGFPAVHDTTSGFRAFRVSALKKIDYDSIISNGYSFLGEMLYRAKENKLSVREVPIIFYEREIGKSKLGKSEIKGFIISVVRVFVHRIFANLHRFTF